MKTSIWRRWAVGKRPDRISAGLPHVADLDGSETSPRPRRRAIGFRTLDRKWWSSDVPR